MPVSKSTLTAKILYFPTAPYTATRVKGATTTMNKTLHYKANAWSFAIDKLFVKTVTVSMSASGIKTYNQAKTAVDPASTRFRILP